MNSIIPSIPATGCGCRCKCNNCSETIEFSAKQSGQTVACPYCKLQTILFIPPPLEQLPAPLDFIPDKPAAKTIAQRRGAAGALSTALLFANLITLIILAIFAGLIWQQLAEAVKPAVWDYQTFSYPGQTSFVDDNQVRHRLSVVFIKLHGFSADGNLAKSDEYVRSVSDVASVLNAIGGDGWELVGIYGDTYIVKRPNGKFHYDLFEIEYR